MHVNDLILEARKQGKTALTESESKTALAQYGIPVVEERVVPSPDKAVDLAETMGYPVVLKGIGARLTHKTERGLVKLNLRSAAAVLAAADEIAVGAGADLEGFLVQPQVQGRREFVAGLFRDPQFGPVIMFGVGGILTEALDDVVFRLAPLDEAEAGRMIGEIRSAKLLRAFRGDEPADQAALMRALIGLSRLACDHPSIREVDINPLIATRTGQIVAVDALVVLEEENAAERPLLPPVPPREVMEALAPQSVALIGASDNIKKWGFRVYTGIAAGNYEGPLYLVNPKGGEIAGRPVYRSPAEIPGDVDLAVVTVPAEQVLPLIPHIRAKGIKKMLIISSGFGEAGPEGRRMEQELVAAARRAGILILGPNTMGVVNTHANFYSIGTHARPRPGAISFISQSGNLGGQLLSGAEREGIGIRYFVGSGNEAMVTVEDYLDACAEDNLTQTIILYIESVKNGRRFFEAVRRISPRKPIIVLKGGRTAEGNKAAASHTGGMASNKRVFDTACRQAGAILVEQPAELFHIATALSSLPLPGGKRVGIVSLGGGWGVVATDLCIENGLVIPPLSEEIKSRIDKILPPYWSRANPIDLVGDADPTVPLKVMEELVRWDGCDACIHLGTVGRPFILQKLHESAKLTDPRADWSAFDDFTAAVRVYEQAYLGAIVRLMEKYGKPIMGAYVREGDGSRTITDAVPGSPFKSIVFRTSEYVIHAMAQLCAYGDWLSQRGKR